MFIQKYYYLWGAALILAGIVVGFFGNSLITFVIGFIAALAVFFFGTLGVYSILDTVGTTVDEWVNWVILGVMALIGIIVGFSMKKFRRFGIALVSAWGGVILGLTLTTVFFIENKGLYYTVIVGCAVIIAILAFKAEKVVIIFVTSFTGGYAIVRGISLYAGGFPSETQLHDMIKSGAIDWSSFPKIFYAYLAGIVVLSLLCFWYQISHSKEKKPRRY